MTLYKIEELLSTLRRSEEMERDLELKATDLGRQLTQTEREKLSELLMSLQGEMSALDALQECADAHLIGGFYNRAQRAGYMAQEAYSELRTRREHIEQVLYSRLFMYIPPDKAEHYKNTNVLDKLTRTAFPSAYEELIEAGNCYAFDCNTACVFHAMRSLEQPIQALAANIPVTMSKDIDVACWGDFIGAIDKQLMHLRNTPHTSERDKRLQFFSEARMKFACFKDAWRNFVAHGRQSYDADSAFAVLSETSAFVEKLAQEGLRE